MNKTGVLKTKYSVQIKYVATFALIIIGLLAFLNTYPPTVFRDLVFTSKRDSMQSQAAVISSSLSPLEELNSDSVGQVMQLLDIDAYSRVIITDASGIILYDTSDTDPKVGRLAFFSEISRALGGEKIFYSKFSGAAFLSRASIPVMSSGTPIGSVYLYDYDSDLGRFILQIQRYFLFISAIVGALAFILILFFIRTQTRRITELVGAIRIVRDGDYDFRIKIRGNDELTELAEELNLLTTRLQSTEEIRRRFVSDASHELKTPLASIHLFSESILDNKQMNMETVMDFVSDIKNESERLQRTTEKLLNLTRLDRDNSIVRAPVDMKRVSETSLHMLTPLAGQYGVSLKSELSEGCFIYAHEDDIYQVIFNLVENGIKYNIPGGVVSVRLNGDSDLVHLTIDDTGIGIPDEDMPHIFSRFYRVDKARSRDAGGSGLGLSIVRDAVKLHGGTVVAQQLEGTGSRFVISFPPYDKEGDCLQ